MTTQRDPRPPHPAPEDETASDPVPPPVDVPDEEAPLDPRAIARASLQAGRNASLWWSSAGVAVSAALSVLWSPRLGPVALALVLLAGAVLRAVSPPPGPVAFSPRARWIDLVTLTGFAVVLLGLTWIVPAWGPYPTFP